MSRIDDEIKELTARSQFDQSLAGMLNVARAMFAYHGAMREAGMTPAHAFRLTRDYHFLMLTKALWPDTPPAFGGDDK